MTKTDKSFRKYAKSPNCLMMSIDFASAESRIMTLWSTNGLDDCHTREAMRLFGVPRIDVTKAMRKFAKLRQYNKLYSRNFNFCSNGAITGRYHSG